VAPVEGLRLEGRRRSRERTPTRTGRYVYTRDSRRACASRGLETGMVGLKTRHGVERVGALRRRQESGVGREGVMRGSSEYLETTYVAVNCRAPGEGARATGADRIARADDP